jgi:hypothetical protein
MAGAGSVSPKKKATTPASQEKKKAPAAKVAEGTGADIRNFVSPLLITRKVTDDAVLTRV